MNAPPTLEGGAPDEFAWFVRLRWGFGGALVLVALVAALAIDDTDLAVRTAALGAIVLLTNLLPSRIHPRVGDRVSRGVIWAMIVIDLAALTLLAVWRGGLGSPVLGLLVLDIIVASRLLPAPAASITAAVAIAFVGIGLAVTRQWPLDLVDWMRATAWAFILALTALLTGRISGQLRLRDDELRGAGERTRAILETAAEGIVTIDDRGTILSVNPAAERMFDFARRELIGRNVRILMPEPDQTHHSEYLERYLRTGEAKIIGIGRRVEGRRRDGSVFPLELAVSEVSVDGERVFTGLIRDISVRDRAERALVRANAELEQHRQTLAQHEKMAALGQMAAGVAHEIANPLASIDSLIQLLERRPERISPETFAQLHTQVDRITGIVRQMTEFAHPNDEEWQRVDLNEAVEGSVDLVRFDRRLQRLELDMRLSRDVGPVSIRPHALQQVLVNLIMNAIHALDGNASGRLVITTRREGAWKLIDVEDNGPGIAPEHVRRVFEPFFTTKPLGEGTGLGLSISYTLVEHLGGRIDVSSVVGKGARFTVFLPADPDGAAVPRPRDRAVESDSSRRRE